METRNTLFIAFLLGLQTNVHANDISSEIDEADTVITATRLRQSLADTPASMTVITRQMIDNYQIRSIVEALRLVPGMAVVQDTGNDFRISYHGTNILSPRRMNILIDGVSAYRTRVARLDWKDLPIDIEDVERIEVTRGPNSATYGANSMLAVINIISKHPNDTENAFAKIGGGSGSAGEAFARYAGRISENTNFRFSAQHQEDRGYDFASTSKYDTANDTSKVNRFNFRSISEISSKDTLDITGSIVQGENYWDYLDKYQVTYPNVTVKDWVGSATWRHLFDQNNEIQFQAYTTRNSDQQPWRTCLPPVVLYPEMYSLWRSNPNYVKALLSGKVPTGGSASDNALAATVIAKNKAAGASASIPVCTNGNQDYDEVRNDFELQYTSVLSKTFRIVTGLSYRQESVDSQTYFDGKVSSKTSAAFFNGEWAPSEWATLNLGGYYESNSLLNSNDFSPRFAVNAHASPNHTFRLIISKATRSPNMMEQNANWSYGATEYSRPLNGDTQGRFYASAVSPGGLVSEKILSREIGYFGNLQSFNTQVDVKAFDDQLSQLISEKHQLFDFHPTNNNSTHLRGIEFQANSLITEKLSANIGYGYLDNDASTTFEQTQYAKHSGSASLSYYLPNNWHVSGGYYSYSSNSFGQSLSTKESMSIMKIFAFGKSKVNLTFTADHLDNRAVTYFVDSGVTKESRYDSAMRYSGFISLSY